VRVLVTGGLGFLGHAVTVNLLAAGHRVTVMSRGRADAKPAAGAELVTADIRDRVRVGEIVRAGDFDGVCHLAAVTSGRDSLADPLTYFDVNAAGTLNLLMGLDTVRNRRPPVAFVLASTNIVYGSRHVGALSEDLDVHPESPYAASKVAAEQMVTAYAETGAIGAVILRCFNVAGAVDGVTDTDPGRIIPNIFRAMAGQAPHVTLNGDGSAIRDFVHVADAADAFRLALTKCEPGQHRVYNIGSGTGTSMADLVETAEQITDIAVSVNRVAPKAEPPRLTSNSDLAATDLGWRPIRSSSSGIIADAWRTWRLS
jgi:UDP-glucose 4-epimerase